MLARNPRTAPITAGRSVTRSGLPREQDPLVVMHTSTAAMSTRSRYAHRTTERCARADHVNAATRPQRRCYHRYWPESGAEIRGTFLATHLAPGDRASGCEPTADGR